MNDLSFALGAFTLLILPGPTNALLVMASHGLSRIGLLEVLAAVVFAYLAIIIPVSSVAGPFLHAHPLALQVVKAISAVWVLYLAFKLWGRSTVASAEFAGPRHVFVTTLLNPKAIIIGLTIIPSAQDGIALGTMMAFVAVALSTSLIWLTAGRLVIGESDHMPLIARRCGSAALMIFSIVLTASALR